MQDSKQLLRLLRDGAYDSALRALYGASEEVLQAQRKRYCAAVQSFAELYGAEREVRLYSAPGRTEIGGNHTDHNNGIVMAAAVTLDILAVVSRNSDEVVRVKSAGFAGQDVVSFKTLEPQEAEKGSSAALVRGVAAGLVQRGGKAAGFDAYTTSDVLRGSGLSSSAAFEVVMGAVFNGEYNADRFSPVEIAQVSQYAENVYFGKPSGLMDQTASSVGGAITIDFADPAAPVVEEVTLNLAKEGFALCITDTKGSHADLTPDYAAIRAEMESVAHVFHKKVLREVEERELVAALPEVRAKTGDRAVLRALHFYAECRRAKQLEAAAREERFSDFLALILAGGHSSFEYNQNAYSPSHPKEQGVALGLALSQRVLEGRGAWRLQGGGFAGTIQAFVPRELLETYRSAMESVFGKNACYVLDIRGAGAGEIKPRS